MDFGAALSYCPRVYFMPSLATLEPLRFGEYLRERNLISEEQWLAALAAHWSEARRTRIGAIIVAHGFLPQHIVDAEARAFHDELEVVEVAPRSEKVTTRIAPPAALASAEL
jgi:hypothetical protein